MSLEKTDAIVVKSVDYSETSLILSVFTRELGKVRGIAKGARRLKNPFETSLDLLASIRLSFIRKNSDALDLFTEAKLRRRFRPTTRNVRGLYGGYYVAELLDLATEDYDPYPDLWTLAEQTLDRFQYGDREDVPARVAYFEAGLLDAFGEFPAVRCCVDCGQPLPLDSVENLARRVYFDVDSGGVVCRQCLATRPHYGLTPTTIGALKVFDVAHRGCAETLKLAVTLGNWRRALEEEVAGLSSIDKTERENDIDGAFAALEADALSPYREFPVDARAQYRILAQKYICKVLRRRPRTYEFLKYAMDEKDRAAVAKAWQEDAEFAQRQV